MNFEDATPFMETHHRGVIGTRRGNGATHSSIVACGAFQGKAAFVSVYAKSVKVSNLRRDPTCTVLCVDDDWRNYAVVEGQAQLYDYGNTNAEEMRQMMRDVYMACSATEHPNWDEFDQAMIDQKAVVVLVSPDKVYGKLH